MQIFMPSQPQLLGEADALELAGGALRDLVEDDDLARHLEVRERSAAKSRIARSVGGLPSRSTTAAATSSPSLGCGMAKVTTCATAGWSIRTPSTSSGLTFSPPRLMISFRRPVRCR
jgi:hypothetical protein